MTSMKQFIHFDAALRYGSFAQAARALGVTSQAISNSISALERDLGYALFERDGRRIAPTEDALRIAPATQQVVNSFHTLEEIARRDDCTMDDYAEVSLGIGSFLYRGSVPAEGVLSLLAKLWPQMSVTWQEVLNESCHHSLEAHTIDLALLIGKPLGPQIISHHVGNCPLLLALSSDHPLASKETITAKDLCELSLAAPFDQLFLRPIVCAVFEKTRIGTEFKNVGPHLEEQLAFLRDGGGILVLPGATLTAQEPGVIARPFAPSLKLSAPLYLAYRKTKTPSPFSLLARHLIRPQVGE